MKGMSTMMMTDQCPDPDCGACEPRQTDCGETKRWDCATTDILDADGTVSVTACRNYVGCNEEA